MPIDRPDGFPSPELLRSYNDILPGAADRIMTMIESESGHRREMQMSRIRVDDQDMKAAYREARIGQVLAFLLATFVIAAGTYVATRISAWPGAFLGGSGLIVPLVSAFIRGRMGPEGTSGHPHQNVAVKERGASVAS